MQVYLDMFACDAGVLGHVCQRRLCSDHTVQLGQSQRRLQQARHVVRPGGSQRRKLATCRVNNVCCAFYSCVVKLHARFTYKRTAR